MTYIPEDAFKNILDFCDDRIERKQRQLMRSIKIERDTEVQAAHLRASQKLDKFTYTAGDQKLLWIRSDDGMQQWWQYYEYVIENGKCGGYNHEGGWWDWVREFYGNINYNYERSWNHRNLVKSKRVYKEGQRMHVLYWI